MAYYRYHKVNTRIVRIFNTYGLRLQIYDGHVISNFMKQRCAVRTPRCTAMVRRRAASVT